MSKLLFIVGSLSLLVISYTCYLNSSIFETTNRDVSRTTTTVETTNQKQKPDINMPLYVVNFKNAYLDNTEELLEYKLIRELLNEEYLDDNTKSEIFGYIVKYASIYNVDPLMVYTVLWKESRLGKNTRHKPVYIERLGKNVQAVGAGAIIWDFWGHELVNNTSLKSKNDLRKLEKNIEATAYIINHINGRLFMSSKSQDISNIYSKYYGARNQKLIQQVNYKYENLNRELEVKIVDTKIIDNKIIYEIESFFSNFVLVQTLVYSDELNKVICSINVYRASKTRIENLKNINKFKSIVETIIRSKNISILVLEDSNDFQFKDYAKYNYDGLTVFYKP